MAERKRLSGAQYRKLKAKKLDETKKQEGYFLKYLCTPRRDDDDPELNNQTEADKEEEEITVSEEFEPQNETHGPEDITISEEFEPQHEIHGKHQEIKSEDEGHEGDNFTGLYVDYGDPATWTKLDDRMRQILIDHGPEQVEQVDFPKDNKQRKFTKVHYNRRLANGEEIRRHWLQYSVSNDSVYCFCCKLFTSNATGSSSLSDKGSRDWKNISAILSGHEKSSGHLENFQSWKELELRLRHTTTIDEEHLRLIKKEEQYWQQILKRLIALARVLGMQNLAFHVTQEKLHTSGNGNFLKFVEFLALFDPLMDEHLRRIRDNETHVHYLGKDIQNELIQLLSNARQNYSICPCC